jgi:hypothetical protein
MDERKDISIFLFIATGSRGNFGSDELFVLESSKGRCNGLYWVLVVITICIK